MSSTSFNEWAVLELMGHRRLAGRVEDIEVFGTRMCRIDIPSEPPVTQFYSAGAIYAVTPTTEEVCRAFAQQQGAPTPINRWDLGALGRQQHIELALPSGSADYDDDEPDYGPVDDEPEGF